MRYSHSSLRGLSNLAQASPSEAFESEAAIEGRARPLEPATVFVAMTPRLGPFSDKQEQHAMASLKVAAQRVLWKSASPKGRAFPTFDRKWVQNRTLLSCEKISGRRTRRKKVRQQTVQTVVNAFARPR